MLTIERLSAAYPKMVFYRVRRIGEKGVKALIGRSRVSECKSTNPTYKCVDCGIEPSYVIEHRHINEPDNVRHWDLFAIVGDPNKSTQLKLMTVDHILPASAGGRNFHTNYNVMCAPCNHRKKNKLTVDEFVDIVNNLNKHVIPNQKSANKLYKYICKFHNKLFEQNIEFRQVIVAFLSEHGIHVKYHHTLSRVMQFFPYSTVTVTYGGQYAITDLFVPVY